MPKFKIQHITRYTYEGVVRDSANQIMLYPVTDLHQEVVLHEISVSGNPSIEIHTDIFNNKAGTFTHTQPHNELVIDSLLEVVTTQKELPSNSVDVSQQWKLLTGIQNKFPYIDFIRHEPFDGLDELTKTIHDVHQPEKTPYQCAMDFCNYVYTDFTYQKGVTTVDTTLGEIWKIKSGVCQDFAHILLAMLRMINIPARYVSGYICPNKDGMRGEGATHAWVEAYLPEYGWLGLDPTNNCVVNENHVRLAVGKNYYDCSPVRGTYRGSSNHKLDVSVIVAYEDGHTTIPEEKKNDDPYLTGKNSFQRHQEMQMQQQ